MSENGDGNTQDDNNNTFLSHLLASNAEIDSNERTFGSGNTERHRKRYGGLEGLFDPPAAAKSDELEMSGEVVKQTPAVEQNGGPHSPESYGGGLPPHSIEGGAPVTNGLPPLRPKQVVSPPKSDRAARPPKAFVPKGLPPLRPGSNQQETLIPENNPGEFLSNLSEPPLSNNTKAAENRKVPIIRRMKQPPLNTNLGGSHPSSSELTTVASNVVVSDLPRPASIANHHKRTVSWGVAVDSPPPSHDDTISDDDFSPYFQRSSVLEQPSLEDTMSSGSLPRDRANRARILSLDDVLRASPLEQEAETSILKALDDLHPVSHVARRNRSDTGTSTIPDLLAHDFSLDDEEEEDGDNDDEDNDTNEPAGSTISRGEDSGGTLKNLASPQSKKQIRPLLHKRSVSVEQRLLGLTLTMAMQDEEEEHLDQHLKSVPETIRVRYEPVDAADELAQHSHLMSKSALQGWLNDGETVAKKPSASIRNLATVMEDDERSERHESPTAGGGHPSTRNGLFRRHRKTTLKHYHSKLKNDTGRWLAFFRARRESIYIYIKTTFFYVIMPVTAVAAVLFYAFDNPETGKNNDSNLASASWWLLFVGVRQVITFSCALCLQGLIIDYLSLSSKIMLRLCGPLITLFVVESKGWPFIFFTWGAINFCTLFGPGPFAAHWAYWQQLIDLFNAANPSGNVVNSLWNQQILTIAMCLSAAVSVKRFLVGIFLGRQTFSNYGPRLAKLMQKMYLLRQVAKHAKEIERCVHALQEDEEAGPVQLTSEASGQQGSPSLHGLAFTSDKFPAENGEDNSSRRSYRSLDTAGAKTTIDMEARDSSLPDNLQHSEQNMIMQLLDQWEEPERSGHGSTNERATISAVLRFRRALTFLRNEYPFSFAFGPADTRENCIESAQNVYRRLLMHTPGEEVLQFETLAMIAEDELGMIDQEKAKELMKLFRPDRKGNLTSLDFVKSVDAIYKTFKLLIASIDNSSKIDKAFDRIISIVFYLVAFTIILSQVGVDPLAMFLSLSSVILAFAFVIGSASSKYFEGMLFVLARRPYNVGDRIHVSDVEVDTSLEGSKGWVVENITLFETTAIWGPTNERCSLSNASLAYSRIINGARSPQAQIWIHLKFPIDTSYDKILVFKTAIEEFLKARPREWLSLKRFLAQQVVSDQGYVAYAVVVQHRSSWQEIGQLLDSKANLSSYCQEVQKQLGMNYHAPPLPVDLKQIISGVGGGSQAAGSESADDIDSVARRDEFRSMALNHR